MAKAIRAISVTIVIDGDEATIDFAGTGPVQPGNLNANRAIVTAAVMYVFRCLITGVFAAAACFPGDSASRCLRAVRARRR